MQEILERNQIIFTAGRKGSFIHKRAVEKAQQIREDVVAQKLADVIELSIEEGFSSKEIQKIFTEQLKVASGGKK